MMSRIVRTRVVIAAVVVGFLLVWACIAFTWAGAPWIAAIAYALLAVGVVVGLLRRRRRPPPPSGDLSASDPYSDLQLGRGPVTHDPRDEASASQIGDPPEGRDPLI